MVALAAVPLLLIPTACGSSSSSSDNSSIDSVKVSGDFNKEPTVTVKNFTPTKTQTRVDTKGDGPAVDTSKPYLANIYAANGTTGKKSVSTFDQAAPIEIRPEQTTQPPLSLISKALNGQPRGTRITVASKVSDAFTPDVAKQVGLDKAKSVVFVVDLVSVQPSNPLAAPKGSTVAPKKGLPKVLTKGTKVTGFDFKGTPKKPSNKLQVIPLVQGTGAPVQAGRYTTFNYFGSVYGGKKPFDESFSKEPITFPVGTGSLIKGWDQGLIGVKAGSRVLMIVPPSYGYASTAKPGIPKNSTLVFVIDVLGVDS